MAYRIDTNAELFREILKMKRKAMGPGNRKRSKGSMTGKKALYPHGIERRYYKYIRSIMRKFTIPGTAFIELRLDRWVSEFKVDSKNIEPFLAANLKEWVYTNRLDSTSNNIDFNKIANTWIKEFRDISRTDEIVFLVPFINDRLSLFASSLKIDSAYDECNSLVSNWIEEFKTDSMAEDLDALTVFLLGIQNEIFVENKELMLSQLMSFGIDTAQWNAKQMQKFFKSILGQEWIIDEPYLNSILKTWSQNNYEITKGLTNDYIKQINNIVSDGVTTGLSHTELAKNISKLNKHFVGYRSKLIARDQIGKLNGVLTKRRNEEAGLELYLWDTAGDERVRSTHKPLDNKLMKWSNPSVYSDDKAKTWKSRSSINGYSGIPGQDIQCRCTSAAWFGELLEDIDNDIDTEKAA